MREAGWRNLREFMAAGEQAPRRRHPASIHDGLAAEQTARDERTRPAAAVPIGNSLPGLQCQETWVARRPRAPRLWDLPFRVLLDQAIDKRRHLLAGAR